MYIPQRFAGWCKCAIAVVALSTSIGGCGGDEHVAPVQAGIVGGQPDLTDAFPFVVDVFRTSRDGEARQCSGTLVGWRHILTAAHCLCAEHVGSDGRKVADASDCVLRAAVRFDKQASSEFRWIAGTVTVHPLFQMNFDAADYVAGVQADNVMLSFVH